MAITSPFFAFFPGQGSQKTGMGKDFFDSSETAQRLFAEADKALGFSLSKICFEGPQDRLTDTAVAQPAILTTSVIAFELFKERGGADPIAAAGHSLGEYSALVAAGVLSFQDAVLLVHKRGRYMQEAVPQGQGKMLAVLGKEPSEIEEVLKQVTGEIISIANINAPGQIVVAGSTAGVEQFIPLMGNAKMIPLQVSAPFHCAMMKPAEENLRKDLKVLNISKGRFPVISNYWAEAKSEPEEIRESLALQVCGKVRWVESVNSAISLFNPSSFVEFGEGSVLSGLAKRIAPAVARHQVQNAAELEAVAAAA